MNYFCMNILFILCNTDFQLTPIPDISNNIEFCPMTAYCPCARDTPAASNIVVE